jgi:PTS system mannose-specific IIC component
MPLIMATFAGLIVGDMEVALKVGATCCLMYLGFYTYGGATTPDYNVGAMFGVVVAHQIRLAGGNIDDAIQQGIVIGSIVALLMSWFDILGRGATTVFQHGGDRALATRKLASFQRWHLAGTISWFLGRFIPVFIGGILIQNAAGIQAIQDFVNNYAWIRNGLRVVGSSLSAVGFALLLSYLDIKKFWPYMFVGFVLFAYLKVPTIGLAIVGIAAAGLWMKDQKEKLAVKAEVQA